MNTENNDFRLQIIDPMEIIEEIAGNSFLYQMNDFIFVLSRKNNEKNEKNSEKNQKKQEILNILGNITINAHNLNFRKTFQIKTEKIEQNFAMIHFFLISQNIKSFDTQNEDFEDFFIDDFLEKMENSQKTSKNDSPFSKFLQNLENFVAICYLFLTLKICRFSNKKSKESINPEKSPYNTAISESSSNLLPNNDFLSLNMDNFLSNRAKIDRLSIRFDDERFLPKKIKNNEVFNDFENEEDLVILKIMREKENNRIQRDFWGFQIKNPEMNSFYYPNFMENLEIMKESNELARNLLNSSKKITASFLQKQQFPIIHTSPMVNFQGFLNSSNFSNLMDGFNLEPNLAGGERKNS